MPAMPTVLTMPIMTWTMVYLLSIYYRMQRGLLLLCTQILNYFHGKQNVKSEQNNPNTGDNTREKVSISHGTILLLLYCLGQKSSKI